MNAFFYPRLALSGMRRDRRIYAPYLTACVFMTPTAPRSTPSAAA